MTDDLRDGDRAVLSHLRDGPASKGDLADVLPYSKSYIGECIENLRRQHGYDIDYRRSDNQYHLLSADGETPEIDEELLDELRSGATLADIQALKDCPKHAAQRLIDDCKERGYTIDERVPEDNERSKVFFIPEGRTDDRYVAGTGDGTYRFALIGDTHLGSEACELDALHDFYDRLEERGITVVFHAGDITDGYEIHRGQINELHGDAIGWERLKEYTIRNYPQRDGIDTYFIEGNHDHQFYKNNSIRYGKLIARERDDLHYRGDSMVRFVFDPVNDIDLELIHPSGGQPYCYSGDTRVLTKDHGFVRLDEMAALISTGVSPTLATFDTDTGSLEYETPDKFVAMPWDGDMIQFRGQSLDLRVTPNHRMVTRENGHHHKHQGDWEIKRADDMADEYVRQKWDIPTNGTWEGVEPDRFELPAEHPNGKPFECDADDFLRFLGWFISEGWTREPGRIQFSQQDKSKIVPDVAATGLTVNTRADKVKTTNRVLAEWLDEHVTKGAKNKRVPEWVTQQSPERIELFLETLFEGDGHATPASDFGGYTTASKQLAHDVIECLLKTGRTGTLRKRERDFDFNDYQGETTVYEISTSDTGHRELTKQPERVGHDGYVYCPSVSNGTVVTMRNGKVAISGNTLGYRAQTLYRERPIDQRPTIAGIGHLHESMYAVAEGVKAFYVGGWKGLTTWGKRKGFGSFIGGWIIELEIEDGEVRRLGLDEVSYPTGDYTEEFASADMNFE